jgi:hypothetical protein
MEEIDQNPNRLNMIYRWPPSKSEERRPSPITSRDQTEAISIVATSQPPSSIIEDTKKSTTTVPTSITVTDDGTPVVSSYVYPRTTTTATSSVRKPDIRSHLRLTSTGGGLYGDLFTLKTIVKLRPIYPSLSAAAKVVTSKDWTVRVCSRGSSMMDGARKEKRGFHNLPTMYGMEFTYPT